MELNVKEIINSTLILFSIIDITGNVPIVISLRNHVGHIQAGKATMVAFVIMLVFLFLGNELLKLIGIDLPSFAIAGSVIIFIMALEMILGIQIMKEVETETASIVPLAFPLLAGPGVFTTLLSIRAEYKVENIVAGIIINLVFVYLVLKRTKYIEQFLGKNGLTVLRKFFGIILLAIAIKLFKTNIGL
ncbi:MAG: MarC family protein [Bacteroidota bacterium]|nr:MarC family protein [Bacteroidota bacterium]